MTIAERYKVYTCFFCKEQRSSIFIEPGTRICQFCFKEKYPWTKEDWLRVKKLNEELNKILNF